ncbi:MAG: hypothetical protein PHF70_01420 [Opitutales bacterium]|nr:hypothetical protein [Opitutales bacterium]
MEPQLLPVLNKNNTSETPTKAEEHDRNPVPERRKVNSFLDAMVDGREYSSLLDVQPNNINLVEEIQRALADIEKARGRRCICYISNVLRAGEPSTPVELQDDLPFAELVGSIPVETKDIDIFVVTPGGSAQQINNFVNRLRPRFDNVAFLIPHMCMSAGTIWVMSGDDIVMDERGFLGPTDPQVLNRENRMVPAQSLFTLVHQIQEDGQRAISKGQQPSWSDLQLLKLLDPKELGNALGATGYSEQLVSEYLKKYKFRTWIQHSSTGAQVNDDDRQMRAKEIAKKLSSHDAWKAHSHGIFRDVLWNEIKLKISHPDDSTLRAMRRMWALCYWIFDNTEVRKLFLSTDYTLLKIKPKTGEK